MYQSRGIGEGINDRRSYNSSIRFNSVFCAVRMAHAISSMEGLMELGVWGTIKTDKCSVCSERAIVISIIAAGLNRPLYLCLSCVSRIKARLVAVEVEGKI